MNPLDQLCYLQGVALNYIDYYGHDKCIDDAVRYAVLTACGHRIDDDEYVLARNFELDGQPWLTPVVPFQVTQSEAPILKVRVCDDKIDTECEITLFFQKERRHHQKVILSECQPLGDYYIASKKYIEYAIVLPELEPEYYQIEGRLTGDLERRIACRLAVSPTRGFTLDTQRQVWGISCQLYTLRGEQQSGFGDFSSLKELIQHASRVGADYLLLNPLHKLALEDPDSVSPYSPSDRNQINPLYISPSLSSDYTAHNAEYYDESDLIDYRQVIAHKTACFEAMYARFCDVELAQNSTRATEFLAFAKAHNDLNLSQFDCYLQWVAHQQLEDCQCYAKAQGMAIGIVLDLAVGCTKVGEEFTRNKELFVTQSSIGAPPDPWAIDGQDWGLAVPNPIQVKAQHFEHFIGLLRANMLSGGGLRMDHVMSLLRLWWCLTLDDKKSRQLRVLSVC